MMKTTFPFSKKHFFSIVAICFSMLCFALALSEFFTKLNVMSFFFGGFAIFFMFYLYRIYTQKYVVWTDESISVNQIIIKRKMLNQLMNVHSTKDAYFFHFKNNKSIEVKKRFLETSDLPIFEEKIKKIKEQIVQNTI